MQPQQLVVCATAVCAADSDSAASPRYTVAQLAAVVILTTPTGDFLPHSGRCRVGRAAAPQKTMTPAHILQLRAQTTPQNPLEDNTTRVEPAPLLQAPNRPQRLHCTSAPSSLLTHRCPTHVLLPGRHSAHHSFVHLLSLCCWRLLLHVGQRSTPPLPA
jgi:hypothetical protein